MKKNQVLFITCTFSITILTIQTFILRLLLQKEIKEEKVDPAYSSISKVISHSVKHNVPLFLIDPKILYRAHVSSDEEDHIDCHFICSGQKVLHLGTIGPLTTQFQKNSFTEALEAESFKVMQFVGFEPILQQHGLNSPIPLHFIISDNHIAIHVAFFYERPGKFWWTGGYNLRKEELRSLYEMDFKKEDLLLLLQSAAFDKMEIHSASIDKIRIFVPLQHHMFLNFPNDSKFIECNYSQAKVFFEKFGRDESDEAEIFRTKAWKLLAKAKSLLDHLKIPFWLSSGTLLGYYRECGFISYSKDVDIGIWIKDFRPEIISLFSTNDMPLIHSFGKVEDSYELSFRDNDLKLDIFFFYEEESYVWNGGTQARTGKKFKYMFSKFELCWTEFLELKVRIPCQTEDYIKANYGQKWYEPVKVWDWKSSPSNVMENGQWPLDEWPEVIQLLPLPEQT